MVNNQTPQQTQPANAVAEANAYADQLLAQDRMINLENMTSGRMGSGGGSALISPEEQQNREIEANKNRQRQIEDAERRSAAMQQAVSPEQRSNLESQQLINNQIKKINRSNFGKIGF
jgi:hypothetical protein